MPQITPRLGYYVIALGVLLQVVGLVSGSGQDASANGGVLSFDTPGDALLIAGMGVTLMGTIAGIISLGPTLSFGDGPRLLPLLPLVLLVTLSVGGGAFAYQMNASNAGTTGVSVSGGPSAQPPGTTSTPVECPPGSFWHEPSQRCLSIDSNGTPTEVTPLAPGATPVCPGGTSWHPIMKHCMQNELLRQPCPSGFFWYAELAYCAPLAAPTVSPGASPTPVCPAGTFWHPAMGHCMETVCPIGYQWDFSIPGCVQLPTPVPTSTPTPVPGATDTPTPEVTSTPTAVATPLCPDGYFWHPAMGHCMSNTCPPGLVFNYDTLYCELPSPTPTGTIAVTATVTPTSTPTALSTPTPTPSGPLCPDGYFWHPAMGHCMSNTCPPGLVFNYETLYCELPPPTPTASR